MISKEEVKHIAKLARLGLNEKEIKKFQKELSDILDYFDSFKKIDVSKVAPTFHPTESLLKDKTGKMRKDEAKPQSSEMANKLVEAAPQREKRHIKIKPVF